MILRVKFVVVVATAILISCSSALGAESEICEDQLSCGDCISLPHCAWCSELKYANFSNIIIPRCDSYENLVKGGCDVNLIQDPKSQVNNTKDDPLSEAGQSEVGKATQIKPQIISIKARAGEKIRINLKYRQAEDYPVDLYYLLDLSQSMSDDLKNLRKLGKTLGDSMKNITRDFKLGFGSFIDKTVMPYISTLPSKLENPCEDAKPCAPSYGYHNDLPLTSNTDKFQAAVSGVSHSSNQDNPEGSLDAMMQSIVCQQQVGWRKDSTHLLLLSTDANFHYAGDGKLGGIVYPNDGECHMTDGSYTMSDKMDYPSIGHLVKKISDYNIQPIFAVTKSVKDTYDKFADMIPKSVVAELSTDSSNIIGLIQQAYRDLKEEVILQMEGPDEVKISNKRSVCPNNKTLEGELKCNDMALDSTAEFSFDIELSRLDVCYREALKLHVSPVGYNEKTTILITPICDCQCDAATLDSNNDCSGNGVFECGACVCDGSFTGSSCECDMDKVASAEDQQPCTMNGTTEVCSGRGICMCGKCLCHRKEDKLIDGEFCECDSTSCPRFEGKVCNNQGECKCNKCECNPYYTGEKCDCSTNQTQCFPPGTTTSTDNTTTTTSLLPCSGNGVCECNQCVCNVDSNQLKYRGIYCENAPSTACDKHKPCIECKAFHTGLYNNSKECAEKCTNYQVKPLEKDESESYRLGCPYQDYTDNCVFEVWYIEQGDTVYAEYRPEKRCTEYINPIWLVIGVIVAVVATGIAALLVWKVYTSMKDAREYKNFITESQNVKFEGGENPIYKQATSTFQNPTFTPGKPSSNL